MEASVTPYQAKLMQEHRERRARIAAAAVSNQPTACEAAPIPQASEEPTAPAIEEWVERQIQIYKPWFAIVEEDDAPQPNNPSIKLIQQICCNHFSISMTALLSPRRHVELVRARQVAIALCKEMTRRSMPEIGRRFGGRDHTTVIHAIRKVNYLENNDSHLAHELKVLRKRIRESCL